MHSPVDQSSLPQDTLSLEFVWKGNSTYWAGDIHSVELYIDKQLRYNVSIPKGDAQARPGRLSFQKTTSGFSNTNVDYLIIKKLETTQKISLKAAIVNSKQGNTMSRNLDGTWARNTVYTCDKVGVDLNCDSFRLGKHYKITVTHSMVRHGSSWNGDHLQATATEEGPCRQLSPVIPQGLSIYQPRSSLPVVGQNCPTPTSSLDPMTLFTTRMQTSQDPHETEFFRLVLEKKFEEAIMFAGQMFNQALGGRLILDLLKHQEVLGINVNLMNNNPLKQTPAHRLAITKNWHAYYALAEMRANTLTEDMSGKTAQDYRTENGMTVFNHREQQQIRQDLFGDTAPVAEAFINQVNDQCRLS